MGLSAILILILIAIALSTSLFMAVFLGDY